jgi:hypothetical protein
MPFETVAAQPCPPEQDKLIRASASFTKAVYEISHPAGPIARISTAENIIYAIFLRLLQMSRSIQSACAEGYAHEQQGLVRSMVSAASDLIYIAGQPNPPSWAMLYAAYSIERRKKIGKGYLKVGIMNQEMFDLWDKDQDQKEQKAFADAKGEGIVPAEKHKTKKGYSAPTWSGFSDADLIGIAGRKWYASYYVPFSDFAHANVMTMEGELAQLKAGAVEIGPRFPARILDYVVTGMADTTSAGIETIDRHFHIGKAEKIAAHEKAMRAAIGEFGATLPESPLECL